MKPKAHVAKNVHIFMVSMYLLAPMLFYPGEKEAPVMALAPNIPVQGMGGGQWIVIEKEEPEVGYFETLFQERVVGAVGVTVPRTAFQTGAGAPPSVPRINWTKVANTALPVTKNLISSGYGWRVAPCSECSSDHQGVDFVPGEGTPVFASLDGVVVDMGYNGGFGVYIILEHVIPTGDGKNFDRWETVYAHMQRDSIPDGVFLGAVVQRKDVIGKVGNTGTSTGPHLHFEIRINGKSVDPVPLLGNYQLIKVNMETGKHEIAYE